MQNGILHITQELEGADQLDVRLSFQGFVHFMKERLAKEKTMRAKFLEFMIHHFEERLEGIHYIELEEMAQYSDLLELMFTCVFPVLTDEHESSWALGVPVTPVVFYGTDTFYDTIRDPMTQEIKACLVDKGDIERKKMNLELMYSLILKRLYGYTFSSGNTVIRSIQDRDTGLVNFYRLNIDLRFVEVVPRNDLPVFDPEFLQSSPPAGEAMAWLLEHLPLNAFRFEGISAITVTEITTEYVVETIKNLILNPGEQDKMTLRKKVIHFLNILAGSNDLQFGLLPLLKVNGHAVYSEETCENSMLSKMGGTDEETEKTYLCLVDYFFREPHLVLYETLPEPEPGENFFLEPLRRAGVRSFAVAPVHYNDHLAGVLEISSRVPDCLNHALLARLEVVIPLLAQLLQHSIDEFDMRIKAVVKENFTSIQPAVEWKFNEVAWNFERMQQRGEAPAMLETIYFKEVYPLYGAIDIRNSTMERNGALRKDLQTQFRRLGETLVSLQHVEDLPLLEELLHNVRKWELALAGVLTTAQELNLNTFLRDTVGEFLTHFSRSRPDMAPLMASYLAATDEATGEVFANRRKLETSIQLINKTVNGYLEEAMASLQESFPVYFEKFRTDGVEYDLYIGQSIAPDHPFDLLYLHNARLWQLNAMVAIARLAHDLLPQMPEPLMITQLIFVHSAAIDISFRKDERRFDVEGGYNIRYEVVKKRIDKVRILDTGERLTQPGKIAIIYFNDREAEEYEGYIRYLQEKDMLNGEVERLQLEELQGV
ncbi:MAG TPA: hypothetical protein VNU70_06845, partial [Puia sp.]|nr:hypothetical protein [Puia sp.]